MAERSGETSKLNCDISKSLKIKLAVFAKLNEKPIWMCVEEALREYLERRKTNV